MKNQTEIEKAKDVLREAGYYVDNLWQAEDVTSRFACTEDEAQEVLEEAFNNDWLTEQMFVEIKEVAMQKYLEKVSIIESQNYDNQI